MATFSYIAKRQDGTDDRGTLVAPSFDAAREELRKRNLMPEDLREVPAVVEKKAKPAPLPWSGANNGSAPALREEPEYAPLHETLRIFAGWLLAWYGVIYALGFLERTGKLPALPFVSELFESRLVLQFTFGTFLLLALSNVHRWFGKGILMGFLLVIAYAALLAGFVAYG
jgi:hypothetical protein